MFSCDTGRDTTPTGAHDDSIRQRLAPTPLPVGPGAALSPDASWVQSSRLEQFTKEQKRRFLPLGPDFVVELISPTDRLPKAQAKMRQWIDNGVTLGWLIDADRRTVYVYRPGQEPEELVNIDRLPGEGIVEGFGLELSEIWRGL